MDSIVQEVGACGKFQTIQVTLIQSCRFAAVWALSLMVFGLYNPGWRCVRNNLNSTSLYNGSDAINGSFNTNGSNSGNITIYNSEDAPVYNGTCSIINSCDYIEFDPSSSTIVSEFGLICDDAWKSKLIVTVLNCGMLLGAFAWGQIGERYGRKVGLYIGNLIMALSCALAVFSSFAWEIYAVFTFFIGIGAVGVIPAVNVLSMEFLSSDWRARVTSLPVWNGGNICFAVVTFLLRDWKFVHLGSAFICCLTCLGFFWAPESLRWLVIHGKVAKAEKVVNKIAKVNKKRVSPEALTNLLNSENSNKTTRNYTYLDLFRTREIRFLTIRLCLMWAISIITYEVIGYGIQSLPGDFYINIIIASSIEFPGILIVGPMANKLGRRRSGILFTAIGVVCCATIVTSLLAMEEGNVRDLLVTGVAIFNRLTIYAIVSLMIPYGAELIPTAVRNLAFGFFNMATRLTGMIASNIIPRDYTSLIVCFAALMFVQGVASVIIWSLAETKGKPLRDGIMSTGRDGHEMDKTGNSADELEPSLERETHNLNQI